MGARDHDDDNKRTLRFFVWRLLKNEWDPGLPRHGGPGLPRHGSEKSENLAPSSILFFLGGPGLLNKMHFSPLSCACAALLFSLAEAQSRGTRCDFEFERERVPDPLVSNPLQGPVRS